MAEGLLRSMAGDSVVVRSAGLEAGHLRPEAIAVMSELGLDISAQRSKSVDDLAGSPGRVFTREQLLASVWGLDYAGDPRTVDTHVKTLRERLSDEAERPRWIETVRGVGYRFREEAN